MFQQDLYLSMTIVIMHGESVRRYRLPSHSLGSGCSGSEMYHFVLLNDSVLCPRRITACVADSSEQQSDAGWTCPLSGLCWQGKVPFIFTLNSWNKLTQWAEQWAQAIMQGCTAAPALFLCWETTATTTTHTAKKGEKWTRR